MAGSREAKSEVSVTATTLAAAIHRVAISDDPVGLARLAQELRRTHPGDPDAETVARQAELKRRRITQEN